MNAAVLPREEYVEQAYFFRTFLERLQASVPSQEILAGIHEEALATTKLPMALEFLAGEIVTSGRISDGMGRLSHYFTAFQTFVMSKAEEERSRFDQRVALKVLEHEAEYRADKPTTAGLFIYQFECIARNKLGYDQGMSAIAADPMYDGNWREWILKIRRELGTVDFADLIYLRSDYAVEEKRKLTRNRDYQPDYPVLFGAKEGRIAKANRGKDPLYMFAALQRQLGYPAVPRAKPQAEAAIPPAIERRMQQLEKRTQLLEMELKGGIDLDQFYQRSSDVKFTDEGIGNRD